MKSIRSRAPVASSTVVRKVMQANKSQDTAPELLLRSALHRAGLRYRKNLRPEPSLKCKADVVFPRARICIFIDGCFWHGCPEHFHLPKKNAEWWHEKVIDNRARDKKKAEALIALGWEVIRIWEHELTEDNIASVVTGVAKMVRRKRQTEGAGNHIRLRH